MQQLEEVHNNKQKDAQSLLIQAYSYEYPIVKQMVSSTGKSEHSSKKPAIQHMGRCRLPLASAEMVANDDSKSPTVSLSQPNTKPLIVKTEIKEETFDEAPSITNSSAETTSDSRSSPIEQAKSPHARLWSGECSWNARRSHFHSSEEIRVKDDSQCSQKSSSEAQNHNRVANLNDLCNHKQINHRLDPWRLHLINLSIEQLEKCQETNVLELQNLFDEQLRSSPNVSKCDDNGKGEDLSSKHLIPSNLDETILTNLQRCTVVSKKLNEIKGQLKTILTHKVNAENIVQKYCTKRNGRKKATTKRNEFGRKDESRNPPNSSIIELRRSVRFVNVMFVKLSVLITHEIG
uniref:Uncharacterized protein n=1 Tax=Romanomermis culicivorax TaxID=13658 RepID=A0A915IPJ5_ROMCU